MQVTTQPIVGQWYLHRASARLFEVIHVDHDTDTVDVHEESGAVHEIDLGEWHRACHI